MAKSARTKAKQKARQRSTSRARPPAPRRAPRRRPVRRNRGLAWVTALVAVGGVATFLALRGPADAPSKGSALVGGDLHSLVVDPGNTSRLYVGGHDAVATSTDGGRTWRQVDSLAGADAMGWAFLGDRVLVGGHPGLWLSEDGGRTFELRNEGLPATDIHALGAGGGVLYAASPQVGVFASLDGGRTWEVRTGEVGHGFMGTILVDPDDPQHLVAPDMEAGAAESTDGGRTWRALGGVGGAMWVSWEPGETDHLVATAVGQAAETTDGGRSWSPLSIPAGASVVEIRPDDPQTMYAAAHEGTSATIWMSEDGGSTWARP
jgi:photosystem II stability/assembly factor-like uncharacterized protein